MDVENAAPQAASVTSVLAAVKASPQPDLESLVRTDGDELAKMLECTELHAYAPKLLPAAFESAPSETYAPRLDAVATCLVAQLEKAALPEAVAKKCAEWLVSELDKLEPRRLLALVESILTSLSATLRAGSDGTKPLALLPKALNVLSTLDKVSLCAVDGTELPDGDAVVKYALGRLVKAPWPAAAMVTLATAVRDIEVPRAALGDLVVKMLRKLDELEPQALPALLYQLLLLADGAAKSTVLREVGAHFERLLADGTDPDVVRAVQGDVCVHIQYAVKQDAALGAAMLKLAKNGGIALTPFSLPMLLSVARIPRFDAPVAACVVGAVGRSLVAAGYKASSPWLAEAAKLSPEPAARALLQQTVRASAAAGWDHLVPSIVSLASALLDTPPPKATKSELTAVADADDADDADAAADGAPAGAARLPVAVQTAALGRELLAEAFRLHEGVRAEALELTFSRIVSRSEASQAWVSFLQHVVESQPLVLLQHTALIKQLLEYVLHLPPPLAAPLLRSLLPLQRQRPELRDHLVMLLRKAMFYKEEELRLTAVHGFLLLLQDTAADAPAGGAAASSSSGSGGGGAQLQLELLNSIRRSFGQQPSIRKALYAGLVPAYAGQPALRELILELLFGQLRLYHDDAAAGSTQAPEAPLRLSECFHQGDTLALVEPLPQLLHALVLCVRHADAHGGGGGGAAAAARERMGAIAAAVARCNLTSFGLAEVEGGATQAKKAGDKLVAKLAAAKLLHSSVAALLEWCVYCEGDGSEQPAATQAAAPTQGSAATLAGNQLTHQLFKLLLAIDGLLLEAGAPLAKKAPAHLHEAEFSLSLGCCEKVLGAVAATQARLAGSQAHYARFVLKATAAKAHGLAATLAAERRGAAATLVGDAKAEELQKVGGCARVLVALMAAAEELDGKEAPSGRRSVNPLTGKKEKAAATEGGEKSKGKEKEGKEGKEKAAPKEKASPSRLQLVLEALEATVALLCAEPSLAPLAAAVGADGDDGAAADGGAAAAERWLAGTVLPLVTRLSRDESHREAEVALRIGGALSAALPSSKLKAALEWAGGFIGGEEVASNPLCKAALSFALTLHRRAHAEPALLGRCAEELHALLHDNMHNEDEGGASTLAMLTEGNANALSAAALEQLELEMAEGEKAADLLARLAGGADGTAAEGTAAAELRGRVHRRYVSHAQVLRELCKSQLMGAPVQHLLKLVTKLFKMLDASFKAMKAPPPDAGDVLEAVCTELCPAVYAMLSFTGSCDTSESAKKVEREAKVVPALVGQIEKFEATIVKLGKKSSTDLLRYMKRATNRDFRISAGEVSKAITDAMAVDDDDDAPAKGKGGAKKRKGKAKEGKGKKAKKDDTDDDED